MSRIVAAATVPPRARRSLEMTTLPSVRTISFTSRATDFASTPPSCSRPASGGIGSCHRPSASRRTSRARPTISTRSITIGDENTDEILGLILTARRETPGGPPGPVAAPILTSLPSTEGGRNDSLILPIVTGWPSASLSRVSARVRRAPGSSAIRTSTAAATVTSSRTPSTTRQPRRRSMQPPTPPQGFPDAILVRPGLHSDHGQEEGRSPEEGEGGIGRANRRRDAGGAGRTARRVGPHGGRRRRRGARVVSRSVRRARDPRRGTANRARGADAVPARRLGTARQAPDDGNREDSGSSSTPSLPCGRTAATGRRTAITACRP